MRAHPEALEADFQEFYGLDLSGIYRGELDLFRAARLAEKLPPGARVRRGDSINAVWMTYEEQILTLALNVLRVIAWQNTKAGHEGKDFPEPLLLPEQAEKRGEVAQANTAKAKALAARLEARRRAAAGEEGDG